MFTAKGFYQGDEIEVTWHNNGILTGDDIGVQLLLAIVPDAQGIGPAGGPYLSGEEILKSDLATFLLLCELLDECVVIDGELTPPPDVPEGAIA